MTGIQMMRFALPFAVLALVAFQAQAQTTSPTPSTAPAPAASQPSAVQPAMPAPSAAAPSAATTPHRTHAKRMTLQQRFDKANTTHDGHLTLDQAKAGLPGVAKHFGAIDKDKKGYVTMEEIHAYNTQHRAHHRTAHNTASPS
ncbi:MAG: hypothetical protein J0H99_26775 [Rhodospirillales bacterium]|nr:hypothetical protein [Rhodospirillales bacterium]